MRDIQALIGGLGMLPGTLSGDTSTIALGLAASLLAPPVIAKMLTNPKAVEVFASPGFARLSMEFSKRQVSRESAATVIRLIGLSQEAGATPDAPAGTPARRRGLTLTEGTPEP